MDTANRYVSPAVPKFVIGFILLWVLGFCLYFILGDKGVLFFMASHRTPILDQFFFWGTKMGEAPMFLFCAVLAGLFRFRYGLMIVFLGFFVLGNSFLLKMVFSHPRPAAVLSSQELQKSPTAINGVELHSGLTSFPSGHTMGGFSLFALMVFLFAERRTWVVILGLVLATIVGLSRLYLWQHFPKDVLFGGLIGVTVAVLFYLADLRRPIQAQSWLDKTRLWITKI